LNPSNPLADDSGIYQASYATALRLLARREHSELELRHKLKGRNFAGNIVDTVIMQLVDEGLLSDHRFAEVYIRGRFERGYGPLRIRAELRERGVSGDSAEQFPGDYRERARQKRFLQQRGFSSDQIQSVFTSP
jgi:regulatory protein